MTEFDDVYELFYNKLNAVCTVHLGYVNGRWFNEITVTGQAPGEDICATIARHLCDALTNHGVVNKR